MAVLSVAVPDDLSQATDAELLHAALCLEDGDTVQLGLEAASNELDAVYTHLADANDVDMAEIVHGVQRRIRVLGELARRHRLEAGESPPVLLAGGGHLGR